MILFFKTFILPIHGSAYDPFSVYMRGFVVNLYLLHQNRQKNTTIYFHVVLISFC